MAINASWHRGHPMPENPSMDDRVRWHEEHSEQCGCRSIPDDVGKELAKRHRRKP
jgi:hypothetical protein